MKSFINDADGYSIKDHIANMLMILLSLTVVITLLLIVGNLFFDIEIYMVDQAMLLTKYLIGIDTVVIPFYFGSKSYDASIKNRM